MTKPRVSVIMRCKNSDWVIAQALAGLFSQTFRDFELIVVDSGSTDKTLEIVKHYPCNLIEIEAKAYYPGKVLNMAIEHAQGDIIVFQNSDSVPLCEYSLERLVAAFDDAQIKGAFGRQIPRPEAVTWVRRDYEISFPVCGEAPPWITLSLPLAAIRKSIWKEHKFYVDAWASEDTEWGNWARNNNHAIKYVADAIVMHSHNYNLKEIYGRRFVEGEADVFIYNNRDNVFKVCKRFLVSTLRDTLYHIRQVEFIEMLKIPARRFVYQWAYYKGNKLGTKRKLRGNDDTSVGQQIVLKHYGSEREIS
ncbi:glycosyltransferase family 2 protein [Candidatus Uabimicrobium sp. HlEnr_7]|uniref:glycosyltransferase family 2 protein n=1 Tax=Candidatus Uabimicrobium helgolandensis TaxID=3095367 RepID=UPI00355642B8